MQLRGAIPISLLCLSLATSSPSIGHGAIRHQALRTTECELYLRRDEGFLSGERTDQGLTPEEYFQDLQTNEKIPRYVLLVGPPGSGKSTWAEAARKQGWVVVSTDSIRQALIRNLQADGEKILVERISSDGNRVQTWEEPNPVDPAHLFSPKYLRAGFEIAAQMTKDALAAGKSVVDDKLNSVAFYRAKDIAAARARGYFVEGLVFESLSAETNLANVALRGRQGGITVPAGVVLNAVKAFRFYNNPLNEDPSYKVPISEHEALVEVSQGTMGELVSKFSNLDEAYLHCDDSVRASIDRCRRQDVFNSIQFVFTPEW
jgi:predicted kinase